MTVQPLRRVFAVVNGGTPTSEPKNWDGEVAWATPMDLGRLNGSRIDETQRTITTDGLRTGSSLVPPGSLIVSTRAPIGYVAETTISMAFNQGCRGLVPRAELDVRFFRYQLLASAERLQSLGQGSTFVELSTAALASFPLRVPPVNDQRAMADYLDLETARIDRLVVIRRKSASLARERFESRVWATATKGLVPATLQASRVAWVGDMPAHWGTPAIGHAFEVQLGKMLNPEATSTGEMFPYLRNENVQWDRIDLGDLNQMHFDLNDRSRYRLEVGDLLVCEGGEVGRAAMWRGDLAPCYYQKALHRVRARQRANTRFLMYVLRAAAGRGVFANEGNSSTFVHLTAEKLRAHRFPCPPIDEQNRIVDELDREAARLVVVESVLSRQIELLLERRQALITAVVTGTLELPGMAA